MRSSEDGRLASVAYMDPGYSMIPLFVEAYNNLPTKFRSDVRGSSRWHSDTSTSSFITMSIADLQLRASGVSSFRCVQVRIIRNVGYEVSANQSSKRVSLGTYLSRDMYE